MLKEWFLSHPCYLGSINWVPHPEEETYISKGQMNLTAIYKVIFEGRG